MAGVCKFSMVDAGRLALDGYPVRRSRTRDEILLGAARLWCRDLSAPTVRAIGGAVGRSPVTVLAPFGSAIRLYAEVIRAEWDVLESGWYSPPSEQAWCFLREHVQTLAEIDRVLLRLPALVHAALSGEEARLPAGGVDDRSASLYVLAAFATTAATVIEVIAQLQRLAVHPRDLTPEAVA
jgi:hypothetical protein